MSEPQTSISREEGALNVSTSVELKEAIGGRLTLPENSASRPGTRATSSAMNWVALRMLTGDRAKYLALIFAISFCSFLIAQQASIFAGIMNRARSQILDVTDADIWVMDPATQYIDEVYALKDTTVERVRSVSGVLWAEPLFKGRAMAKASDGKFRSVVLLGLEDASLAGAPPLPLTG